MFMYKIKSDKRGMTLIEMIISLVILSILMTSTLGMITSSMSIFTSTSEAAIDRLVGNSVYSTLQSTLRYATKITLSETPIPESKAKSFYIDAPADKDSGILKYREKGGNYANLYDQNYYKGRTVQYSIHQAGKLGQTGTDNRHLRIEVKIFREGKVVYTKNSIIKCINLDLVASSGNVLVDYTNPSSINQYIYFSADDLLAAGGDVAWSTEFKINEYMNRYNTILAEYYNNFGLANSKLVEIYDNNADEDGKRVQIDTLTGVVQARNIAVFGDGTDKKPKAGNNPKNFFNLRGYYRDQIYKLLKFTPKRANLASDNPFEGVVATKEELYTGFLLTYFDENGNGSISRDEYPYFENDFFEGTVLKRYNGPDNGVKIMCYFDDNIDEKFQEICTETVRPIYVYEREGPVVSSMTVSNFPSYAEQVKSAGAENVGSVPQNIIDYNNWAGNDDTARQQLFRSFRYKNHSSQATAHEIVYIKQNPSKTENPKVIGKYAEGYPETRWLQNIFGYKTWPDGGLTVNEIRNRLNTKLNPIQLNPTGEPQKGLSYNRGIAGQIPVTCYTFEADRDLYEGWYCYISGWAESVKAHGKSGNEEARNIFYFYLAGPDLTNNSEIDNLLVSGDKKIAVRQGGKIKLYINAGDGNAYDAEFYTYDQASTRQGEVTSQKTVDVKFYGTELHQYVDFILYAADWNSWFKTNQTGLLNELIGNIANIFTGLSEVNTISGRNAEKVLGLKGQFNVNNISKNMCSYNMCWMVYDAHRGVWYYLPANSNSINSGWSNITWTSYKNSPTPLNLASWEYSSSQVNDSIEKMVLPADTLFELIKYETDARWVSLPTGDRIDRNEILQKNPIV